MLWPWKAAIHQNCTYMGQPATSPHLQSLCVEKRALVQETWKNMSRSESVVILANEIISSVSRISRSWAKLPHGCLSLAHQPIAAGRTQKTGPIYSARKHWLLNLRSLSMLLAALASHPFQTSWCLFIRFWVYPTTCFSTTLFTKKCYQWCWICVLGGLLRASCWI